MVLRIGTLSHAKGFIANKLWQQRRIGGKHIPVEVLSHGYNPQYRHLIKDALQELKSEGVVVVIKKRTGRGTSEHASLDPRKLRQIRGLLNAYRESVGLPRLWRDLETEL